MDLAEKLQVLRKNRGYTQEKLAEELHVSRQAVAKWETGAACPDVANLIRISDLLHVTVDYLVREQTCGVPPVREDADELDEILQFRLRAGRNTYAADRNGVDPARPGSRDFRYEEGPYIYYDTYVGGERFAGEEAVWKDGRAVYAMNYIGRVLKETFSGSFLKEALRAADAAMPYRGPEYYRSGEYVYKCRVSGGPAWYQGCEEIYCRQEKVYECRFQGGAVR